MARADWPCKSDTTTPKRMPASVSSLCSRLYLAGQHAAEFLPVSGNVTQAAQVRFGNEGGAQETCTRQRCQPLRISHIGLATRHRLDVASVDHPRHYAHRLQRRIRALPVNAGALHNHDIRAN